VSSCMAFRCQVGFKGSRRPVARYEPPSR
jgi:hypothetical protein